MATSDKSGVYAITCVETGKCYVGSSHRIAGRWAHHRRLLNAGKSPCLYLQHAWTKYGAQTFEFKILEECAQADLLTCEEHYIRRLEPVFNMMRALVPWTPSSEMQTKVIAANKARAAVRTHCPHGHPYNAENTYYGKKFNDRRCRTCAYNRVKTVLTTETVEQRKARRLRMKDYYERTREQRLAQMATYAASRKAEKREYDRQRRERLREAA
jgi:group I intron endonuclease